jgi:hypothetical protein
MKKKKIAHSLNQKLFKLLNKKHLDQTKKSLKVILRKINKIQIGNLKFKKINHIIYFLIIVRKLIRI